MVNNEVKIFHDNSLLKKVLTPYSTNCHYLQSAQVEYLKFKKQSLVALGNFSIPTSCYIADTGHFNAVEFNICYNQLAYYLFAECIQHRLLDVFLDWNIETYIHYQLSKFFIVTLTSSFHKPINAVQFNGYVQFVKAFKKNKTIFVQTKCGFSDQHQGSAEGQVLLAALSLI